MIFKRITSEGLAHHSYLIGSGPTSAVIDPRRDIQVYLDLAASQGTRIKYIFETHRNEDYLIGSLQLSKYTQASIYHGPGMDWKYGNLLADGQEFLLDRLKLVALHTPGHTDESMSYIVYDRSSGGKPVMVFTGDNLFVGETGRVDFGGADQTPRMAANLYDSIHLKLLPLGDGVILCPAHGAGSVCGDNISDRDESTLGLEKQQNPALQFKSKADFVQAKVAECHEKPPYFSMMEKWNQEGPPLLDLATRPEWLLPNEFKKEKESGAIVIDTSRPAAFGGVHIQGSYSIWLDGLSAFAGWFLPYDQSILLVLEEPGHLDQARNYLQRIGYDHISGVLRGEMEGWTNAGFPIESLPLLSVHGLKTKLDKGEGLTVLDVRTQKEWESRHIQGSLNIYVGHLEGRLGDVPTDQPVAVICNVGHRASIGASILLRNGFRNVSNVPGSILAWKNAGFPLISKI